MNSFDHAAARVGLRRFLRMAGCPNDCIPMGDSPAVMVRLHCMTFLHGGTPWKIMLRHVREFRKSREDASRLASLMAANKGK